MISTKAKQPTSTIDKFLERCPSIVLLLTAYASLLCGVHLMGYWTKFNIFIFEYISVMDVLMLALGPGLLVIFSATVAFFLIMQIARTIRLTDEGYVPELDTPWKWTITIVAGIVCVFVLSSVTASITVLSIILMVTGLTAYCMSYPPIVRIFRSVLTRFYVLAMLIMVPGLAFCKARESAVRVDDNLSFYYIRANALKETGNLKKMEVLKFLGHGGEYYFFETLDARARVILKYSDFKLLELHYYRSGKEDASYYSIFKNWYLRRQSPQKS